MKVIADIRLERKFSGDKVWFTSDTHFYHKNIIKFCNRPFETFEQMNEVLIANWNETVPEDGIVFHLGDFCYGGSVEWTEIIKRLNGTIYLVLGNHDMKNIRQGYMALFEGVMQQMTIRVDNQKMILNHNPFLCYGGAYRDVWQLFGHVHSGPNSNTGLDCPRLSALFPLQYDVGVDNNDYRPVSFAEVSAKIAAQVEESRRLICIPEFLDKANIRRVIFLDPSICFCNADFGRGVPQKYSDALNRLIDSTGANVVVIGSWTAHGLDKCMDIWQKMGLPGSVCGIAGGWGDVKTRIGRWISSVGGGFRYVYLGDEPLLDYRAVTISELAGITTEDVEKAISILS